MSSCLHRTIFMDGSHNQIRFYDFASVMTTLGPMVEPVSYSRLSTYGSEFDPGDELTRVDNIDTIDILEEKETKLGAGAVLHGGCQGPRVFHYNQ